MGWTYRSGLLLAVMLGAGCGDGATGTTDAGVVLPGQGARCSRDFANDALCGGGTPAFHYCLGADPPGEGCVAARDPSGMFIDWCCPRAVE